MFYYKLVNKLFILRNSIPIALGPISARFYLFVPFAPTSFAPCFA